MWWSWVGGYRYFKLDVQSTENPEWFFHLGAENCIRLRRQASTASIPTWPWFRWPTSSPARHQGRARSEDALRRLQPRRPDHRHRFNRWLHVVAGGSRVPAAVRQVRPGLRRHGNAAGAVAVRGAMRLLSLVLVAACSTNNASREPDEYTGCTGDEQYRLFSDDEAHTTVDDTRAPQLLPADGHCAILTQAGVELESGSERSGSERRRRPLHGRHRRMQRVLPGVQLGRAHDAAPAADLGRHVRPAFLYRR